MNHLSFKPQPKRSQRAQGMVEFALAIPIFLLLVFGIIEFGRLLMTFSAVFSASREAARYGAAVGTTDSGVRFDHDCDGMRAAAVRVGALGGVQASMVSIQLLNPDGSVKDADWCTQDNSAKESNLGDIIAVSVNGRFWPVMPLVNIPFVPVSASTSRTIIENVEVYGTPQPTTAPVVDNNNLILTIEVNPPSAGTVIKNPNQATYQYGNVVTLTAVANIGWRFSSWSRDLSGSGNPTTILMNYNKTVIANFEPVFYTLAVTNEPDTGGTVTVSPNTATHPGGETVTVSASPAPGYTFSGWTGAVTSSNPTVSILMDADKALTAHYTLIDYTLTVTTAGEGTVSIDKTGPYHYGDKVTLTPNPADGWKFTAWSGTMTGGANPGVITIKGNSTVKATFEEGNYLLQVSIASGNGKITRSPDQSSYKPGTMVTLTATPDPGWLFSAWGGDAGSGNSNPLIVVMDSDKNINANFDEITYTLTFTVVGQGRVVTNKPGPYHFNEVVDLSVETGVGYAFTGWSGDMTGTLSPVSITITGNRNITATFSPLEFTLTINIIGRGNVTTIPVKTTFHYGDVVQLSANPEAGWGFRGWGVDLSGTANPASITVDGNKVVSATFVRNCASPDLIQVSMTGGVGSSDVSFMITNSSDFDIDIMSMVVTWTTGNASGKLTQIYLGANSTPIWSGSIHKNSSPFIVSAWDLTQSRTIPSNSTMSVRVHFESTVDKASITPMTFSNVCSN